MTICWWLWLLAHTHTHTHPYTHTLTPSQVDIELYPQSVLELAMRSQELSHTMGRFRSSELVLKVVGREEYLLERVALIRYKVRNCSWRAHGTRLKIVVVCLPLVHSKLCGQADMPRDESKTVPRASSQGQGHVYSASAWAAADGTEPVWTGWRGPW